MQLTCTFLVLDQQAHTGAPTMHQGVQSAGHQSSRPREHLVRGPELGWLGVVNDFVSLCGLCPERLAYLIGGGRAPWRKNLEMENINVK